MHERCQANVVNPQGENEGIWVTVPEFMRIKRGVLSKKTIYRYIKKGIFKSKKTDNKIYKINMLVEDFQDAEKILHLRKLKESGKLVPKRNRQLHRIEFDIPLMDIGLFFSLAPIVINPLLIAERCSRIAIAHKQVIEVDGNVYSKLKDTAKQFGMTVPVLTQHIIYQIITEKIQQ